MTKPEKPAGADAEQAEPLSPATLCVHAGYRATPGSKGVVAPIVQSSTFLLDDEAYALRAAGRSTEALIYTRETNPTLQAVEGRITALETAGSGAAAGPGPQDVRSLVFASGQAALHAVLLAGLERGDHVVAARNLYGGSLALLELLLPRLGVECSLVEITDLRAVAAALRPATRLLFCESISNPTLVVADIPALAEIAHRGAPRDGARLLVDATFATPIAQRPLALGADVVYHSATKYLGGHSDLIGGVVSGTAELMRQVSAWRVRAGGCMDPHVAFLLDRGVRTLAVRMAAHSAGAAHVAAFLAGHPRVAAVHYPGLTSHPSHAVAARVLGGAGVEPLYGGMVSFEHRDGDAAALACVRRLTLFLEAASLGGVESLVSLPFNMSHVDMSAEERLAAGICPGLTRLSIGIEDPRDLVADLGRALGGASGGRAAGPPPRGGSR